LASKLPLRSPQLEEASGLEHINQSKGSSLTAPGNSELIGDRVGPSRPDVLRIVPERVVAVDRYIPPALLVQLGLR
jgi:hypothetical protein